ncbi:MAG: sodium:solute symporter [Planctomycetota bacterium]|nr:MAG: sodium:solute symporter [Planctomycetota bacterium]
MPPEADAGISAGYGPIAMLLVMMAVSVWLGTQAQKAVERGGFMKGYFLGNRGLGAWALALTATVQSGGTFMGFPSLVYTHGWIVALWIASYMVVPITGFAVLGKRFAQLSRRTGAITVPDLFDARYGDQRVGIVASLAILAFMTFLMIAQFKAGALVMKLTWPEGLSLGESFLATTDPGGVDGRYLVGLAVFAITVVGYTLIGGFLASVWTDLFQSVLMLIGVVLLFMLVVPFASQNGMHTPTLEAVAATDNAYAFGPGYSPSGLAFLPLGVAISFFFIWPVGGIGSPAGMVRLMACNSTDTLRRSIVLLSFYNVLIYIPLIVICICGRALMPDVQTSDEIIPRLAIWAAPDFAGGSLVSGLILAAPFGAVMATVSTFLVVIASGVVRDVYQRFLRPNAGETEIRRLTHVVMVVLGVIGVVSNISPVEFLQKLVVFSASATASTFVAPALVLAYWRRATAVGSMAGMIGGAAAVLTLFTCGPLVEGKNLFDPYQLFGVDPVVWGLAASAVLCVVVSLVTSPPPEEHVSRLFDAVPPTSGAEGVPA